MIQLISISKDSYIISKDTTVYQLLFKDEWISGTRYNHLSLRIVELLHCGARSNVELPTRIYDIDISRDSVMANLCTELATNGAYCSK